MIDESEKNDDTRKISAISKKLQPLGLYTPFKDISELKDNVSKILQAEVMNLIRKQGQVMPEIHKYIEISDTNEFISNFSSNNKLVLNKGYYDMLDFERENTDNIFKEEVFDGNQLVVSNISNVTVVGDNSTLLVNPRYANVICFRGIQISFLTEEEQQLVYEQMMELHVKLTMEMAIKLRAHSGDLNLAMVRRYLTKTVDPKDRPMNIKVAEKISKKYFKGKDQKTIDDILEILVI